MEVAGTYLDAFQAFVDANSHDTECLKHATIVTKVSPNEYIITGECFITFVIDRWRSPSCSTSKRSTDAHPQREAPTRYRGSASWGDGIRVRTAREVPPWADPPIL